MKLCVDDDDDDGGGGGGDDDDHDVWWWTSFQARSDKKKTIFRPVYSAVGGEMVLRVGVGEKGGCKE